MSNELPGVDEARLRAAVECSPSGLLIVDDRGRIVLVNREIERLFGYPRAELIGQSVDVLVPDRFASAHPRNRARFEHDPQARAMGAGRDLFGRRRDGTEVPLEIGLTPVPTTDGTFVLAAVVDITARKESEAQQRRLEGQLRQSQKMEAVGTLAGGIAHDFNNILGVVLGYAEVLKTSLAGEQAQSDLHELVVAALRGRDVVERILAFSRRAVPEMRPLDITALLHGAAKHVRMNLPSQVELRVSIARDTPRVRADVTSLHQVIMNLVNNAVQAMPNGGVLELVAEPLYLHDHQVRLHPDLREGSYVHLAVRDTGDGIPPDLLERVFEPFFTTKEPGRGTGLGLAMVHGIVKEHGGVVLLESAMGEGTRVRCFLPAIALDDGEPTTATTDKARGNGERLLVLDDERALLDVVVRHLKLLGYDAAGFVKAEEALQALGDAEPPFRLVVTDYYMPGMNGLNFATRVAQTRPGTLVLMVTGSFNELSAEVLESHHVHRLLHKPVQAHALSQVLHEMLTSAGATGKE